MLTVWRRVEAQLRFTPGMCDQTRSWLFGLLFFPRLLRLELFLPFGFALLLFLHPLARCFFRREALVLFFALQLFARQAKFFCLIMQR